MSQLENIESLQKRLWKSADTLRSNSGLASNQYMMPVLGLIFLRQAYNRFVEVKEIIEASLPKRGGKTRPLTKEDFMSKNAVFLKEESQFDYLLNLPEDVDLAEKLENAMKQIEEDYPEIAGVLPKSEYKEIDNDSLRRIIKIFNDPELTQAKGDVFGRIYEYFLTGFADQGAHDNGEFFTPPSLVQMLVNVIEPDHGKVIDPACGSCGMFVQSAHFVEKQNLNPNKLLTFYGMEKNKLTIKLAQMNLFVHGLTGKVEEAISYYSDPHELIGKADFVMANPPFNVDEVDAEKVKKDKRLPFGLPGVNKEKKVSNGNYLWISYFYSYLNEKGRAGFVMSSQASSAGGDEAKVRQKLIETGHVDAMIDIRGNFFYTRTVPCQLWFFDKNKPKKLQDKVLIIDARNVYRKVTRKIMDFSPEQLKNLTSIVWLYRGQADRFVKLVEEHLSNAVERMSPCPIAHNEYVEAISEALATLKPFIDSTSKNGEHRELWKEFNESFEEVKGHNGLIATDSKKIADKWAKSKKDNDSLLKFSETLSPFNDSLKTAIKEVDHLYKIYSKLVEYSEKELNAKDSDKYDRSGISRQRKALDEIRLKTGIVLKEVIYFYKQAHWLQEKFPEAKLKDVEGLVKLVSKDELKKHEWSLTPGRYVGVAPEVEEEGFDFEETFKNINEELVSLFDECVEIQKRIKDVFEKIV